VNTSDKDAIKELSDRLNGKQQRIQMPLGEFLNQVSDNPYPHFRDIFQLFHDFIYHYVPKGVNEYPNDPESIDYINYDFSKIFVEGVDSPFFADRLFANKLVRLTDSFKRGAQQNKIYLFEGPHGSGKSTFLNNMLSKFEEYANTPEGTMYEVIWKLDKKKLGWAPHGLEDRVQEPAGDPMESKGQQGRGPRRNPLFIPNSEYLEVPCPSHDNPLLMIPKAHRREFLSSLIKDKELKEKLFNSKECEWVFKEDPCTICTSLYQALLDKLGSPEEVFNMLFVRKYIFNKRLGEGVSVFNAGDELHRTNVLTNEAIYFQLADLFGDSKKVQYVYSRYAKTNNGIYALMDIKNNNVHRLTGLHGIISEGVHKVEDLEENVNSLFMAVINPEDEADIKKDKMKAFLDRLDYTRLPYIRDYNTECEIYKSIFGKEIGAKFLPRVLDNFAKAVISSRLNIESEALNEWIGNTYEYTRFCDKNLLLLKMDIYTGTFPSWLSGEHRKAFTARLRKKLIYEESENEGFEGFSGRASLQLFDKFYSTFTKQDKLITMADVDKFFDKEGIVDKIPEEFLESLRDFYDYAILQELKESLYDYNEKKIENDIKNYLFAINFEAGAVDKIKCSYTGETLELTEEFFENIELRVLGRAANYHQRWSFRKYAQKEYVSQTVVQEMQVEGKKITETTLYKNLLERYVHNIKEKVLDPFIENDNFRNAIKEYGAKEFDTYDKRIKQDVNYLLKNLQSKFEYTKEGAKQMCVYVVDNDIALKFS